MRENYIQCLYIYLLFYFIRCSFILLIIYPYSFAHYHLHILPLYHLSSLNQFFSFPHLMVHRAGNNTSLIVFLEALDILGHLPSDH